MQQAKTLIGHEGGLVVYDICLVDHTRRPDEHVVHYFDIYGEMGDHPKEYKTPEV